MFFHKGLNVLIWMRENHFSGRPFEGVDSESRKLIRPAPYKQQVHL
jgi:hypothetical protein